MTKFKTEEWAQKAGAPVEVEVQTVFATVNTCDGVVGLYSVEIGGAEFKIDAATANYLLAQLGDITGKDR